MRVLFWGTPEFATSALRALVGEGFDVVGVVTQPDRPHGRSRSTLVPPPVKVVAQAEDIPVLQPERPRGDEFIASLRALAPDVSIVVAYGHILPRDVIDLPPRGTLNIHASLLPALRGAAPIQAAIRNGLTETGVTVMRMVEALDAGPIVHQETVPILPDETYGELQMRLAELGAQALIDGLAFSRPARRRKRRRRNPARRTRRRSRARRAASTGCGRRQRSRASFARMIRSRARGPRCASTNCACSALARCTWTADRLARFSRSRRPEWSSPRARGPCWSAPRTPRTSGGCRPRNCSPGGKSPSATCSARRASGRAPLPRADANRPPSCAAHTIATPPPARAARAARCPAAQAPDRARGAA